VVAIVRRYHTHRNNGISAGRTEGGGMNRFTPTFFNNNFFMDEDEDGDYVLYTDHLAEVEQWQRIIVTHVDVIAEKDEQIGEQIRLAKLLHDDLRGVIAEKDKQIAYNQGCYDDASGEWRLEEQDLRKMLADKEAHIKELTEALEKIKMMAKDATGERNMSPERVIRIVEAVLGGKGGVCVPYELEDRTREIIERERRAYKAETIEGVERRTP